MRQTTRSMPSQPASACLLGEHPQTRPRVPLQLEDLARVLKTV